MDLRRARAIFRIENRISVQELNTLFRDLVKKYHPDKVRDHPEWAHERMAEINGAFETLTAWITSPVEPPAEPADGPESEPPPDVSDMESPSQSASRLNRRDAERFYPAFHTFLDGMGLFYQYGLDKVSYRSEGVRRFRYREALRAMEKGRDSLEELVEHTEHPAVSGAARFARLSLADIQLGEPVLEDSREYRKFDSRMRSARRMFDLAVRDILFPELVPEHQRGRHTAGLYACYTEFVLYLTVFDSGERRKFGILQTARYDAFMAMLSMRSEGMLDF